MPLYTYQREDGTRFVVRQKMTDKPLEVEPETGKRVIRVIVSATPVIFKTHGFYKTDSARSA